MFEIWIANMFDDDILQRHIIDFKELQEAREFIEYQANTQSENYVIVHNGKRIDL